MKQSNRVKAAMRAGRKAYGYNLSFPSPWVIDMASMGRLAWISLRTFAGPPNAIT
jgi:hypothetical protein